MEKSPSIRDLLSNGIEWKLGGGQSINVWQHKFVNHTHTNKVITPMDEEFKDLRVSDLIYPEVGVWDFTKVNTMFYQMDCEIILQISLNNLDSENIPILKGHAKGLFTVKGTYKLIRVLETANNTEGTTSGHQTFKYNQIWSIDIPKKINHFIFKAIHNRLATIDNLIKRGIIVPNICSLCQKNSED
ncbi:hypothetical protein LIER_33012 [Lithospermum erythrorhizon]|uniref:Reverse transcriptase zinc-binding domain-containing protein n=1 Tax=Lithospermum erythrorhizon TaxID=34254 RepID=A0AAV3RWE3_LITER